MAEKPTPTSPQQNSENQTSMKQQPAQNSAETIPSTTTAPTKVLSEEFYRYPIDITELVNHGCYYFKLQFAPEYKLQPKFGVAEIQLNAAGKDSEGLLTDITNTLASATQATQSDSPMDVVAQLWNNYTSVYAMQAKKFGINSSVGMNTADATAQLIKDSKKELKIGAVYDGQSMHVGHIFLPLNTLKIQRRAGLSTAQGVYSSVKQQLINEAVKAIETEALGGIMGTAARGQGMTENPFIGHVMSNAEFESYELEWELLPRNTKEMENILKILVFFQGACLSNLDINNKNNLKWVLPPQVDMGVMVLTLVDIKSEGLRDIINGRDVNFEDITTTKNKFGSLSNQIKAAKVFWLRPKMKVFVQGVTIEPLENKGGVLLSPEGFPMGVRLNVSLLRVTYSTVQDLFKKVNNADTVKEGSLNKAESIKQANPYG